MIEIFIVVTKEKSPPCVKILHRGNVESYLKKGKHDRDLYCCHCGEESSVCEDPSQLTKRVKLNGTRVIFSEMTH